ncbi:MAG: PRC-barrel domain-containing protein [Deltaproteobacteria bacterium]|jgi:sporulation protein YlmC with PRC-barrel domain|nr:PRC-barrel domain-containing protein [Deltaproteobacteria bacterium]
MKNTTISLIAVMASLSLICSAFAAGEKSADESAGAQQNYQLSQSQIPSADELKGLKVINQNGEEIGQIEEVSTDSQTGQINIVTLSRGGVLGMGEEQIAAPVEAFRFDMEQKQAQLTVDQSKLDSAPKQANMDNKSFERKLESHYGVSPAWEDQQQDQDTHMQDDMGQDAPMEMDEQNKSRY